MVGQVEAEHERQRRQRPKRRGRARKTVVTGYLIGDDSTQHKPKGKKMGGLGQHYSTTAERQVSGHCLAQSLYVLLGRRCPLAPQMYRQKAVCQREGVPFQSKVDMMKATLRDFQPVPDTLTHVLVDSWYTCRRIWRTARERGFLITSGLKANRWLWITDAQGQEQWMRLHEYAAQVPPAQYQKMTWPEQGEPRTVCVHVVRMRVRKLYTCQVVIARFALDCPLKAVRYWASSDLDAAAPTLITLSLPDGLSKSYSVMPKTCSASTSTNLWTPPPSCASGRSSWPPTPSWTKNVPGFSTTARRM
jgi:hypothetical protein